jgi:hypothetical protein
VRVARSVAEAKPTRADWRPQMTVVEVNDLIHSL